MTSNSDNYDIAVLGTNCQVSSSLNATDSDGTIEVAGVMFSLVAKQDIEVLTFEFAHLFQSIENDVISDEEGGQSIEIYIRTGGEYLDAVGNDIEWIEIVNTKAYVTPQSAGYASVIPRNSMRSIKMQTGQELSFYVTLTNARMTTKQSTDKDLFTGDVYVGDEYLDVTVGIGFDGYPFPNERDLNRVFQGAVHYRATETCSGLLVTNPDPYSMKLSFALNFDSADSSGFTTKLSDQLKVYMGTNVELRRLRDSHGLTLGRITDENVGSGASSGKFAIGPFPPPGNTPC